MRKIFSLVLSAALAIPDRGMAHEPGTYESPIVEQRVKRFKQSGGVFRRFSKSIWPKNYAIEKPPYDGGLGSKCPMLFPKAVTFGADPSIWENFSDFKKK